MLNVFKLFYKSRGGESTSFDKPDYHYPLGEIESDNIQEVVEITNMFSKESGISIDEMSLDLKNRSCEYDRERTVTTGIFDTKKKYSSRIA
jgi:hypothetical protein